MIETSLDVIGRFRNVQLQNEYLQYCMGQRSKLSYPIITLMILAWAIAETIASTWLYKEGLVGHDREEIECFGIISLILSLVGLGTCSFLCYSSIRGRSDDTLLPSYLQVVFVVSISLLFILKTIKHIHLGSPPCLPTQLNLQKLITDSLPSNIPLAQLEMIDNLLAIANLPPQCPPDNSIVSLISYEMILVMSFCPQILMAILFEPRLYLLLGFHFPTAVLVCYSIYSSYYALVPVSIAFIIIAFLLADLHYQRIQGFLDQRKMKQLLDENEKNADINHATEMRHMIGNVAHDLKTPLASFINGLDLIKDIILTAQDRAEKETQCSSEILGECCSSINSCLLNIRNTNAFMLMTINRCIDYTKASKGMKLVPKYETVDLREALQFPIECMSNIQERIGITVEPLSKEICSHIITDKQWLQENLLCLLSNAVKYCNAGNVTISASLVTETTMPIAKPEILSKQSTINMNKILPVISTDSNDTASVSTTSLMFEIEDTGIGLSEEAMKNLFNPFKQAQRLAGGTGLGLYSLAKRMEALKGNYGVKQRKDGMQGSLFWFAIPYRPDSVLSAALRDPSLQEPSRSCKRTKSESPRSAKSLEILVVDDAPSILKMSSMLLKRQGHKISTAENGQIALKSIEEKWRGSGRGYDLVLMDLQMPVMDGLEATRRLRQMELEGRDWMVWNELHGNQTCHQVIIGLSANSDHDTMSDAYQAGVDEFFGKPFSLETFNKTIAKFFSVSNV